MTCDTSLIRTVALHSTIVPGGPSSLNNSLAHLVGSIMSISGPKALCAHVAAADTAVTPVGLTHPTSTVDSPHGLPTIPTLSSVALTIVRAGTPAADSTYCYHHSLIDPSDASLSSVHRHCGGAERWVPGVRVAVTASGPSPIITGIIVENTRPCGPSLDLRSGYNGSGRAAMPPAVGGTHPASGGVRDCCVVSNENVYVQIAVYWLSYY